MYKNDKVIRRYSEPFKLKILDELTTGKLNKYQLGKAYGINPSTINEWIKKYDVSSIHGFLLVGERCDPDTILWIRKHFPNVLINDTWWQTETGWPITGNLLNMNEWGKVFPTLPGSVTRPVHGYDVRIFNE